ncbi:TraB/GumN family protein [Leptospira sp. GIMC2001]|nr:TraB/GumN family protein [Leptospira sp. GIMC2001]WCL47625.1 TraB/GumN family protein [Leptospira sp. GIMC2001]
MNSTKKNKKVIDSREPTRELQIGDCQVTILGTAHVSEESVKEVKRLAEIIKPDTICVELCESRIRSIKDPDYFKKLDVFKVFKERKMYLLMSSLILSSFQKKMGHGEIRPGDELREGMDQATVYGAKLIPIDREIQTTLKRAWGTVGGFSKMYLLSALITSLFVKENVSEEKIEEMKSEDVLNDLFSQIPNRYAKVKRVIIDERDQYLAQRIRDAAVGSKKLLAIVGAGHLNGIITHIEEDSDIQELDIVPAKTWWDKAKVILFPMFFIALFSLAFWKGGAKVGTDLIWSWIIVKSTLAGIGALIALAHPVSLLLAVLAAPLGNFNPIIKPGWVAALSESWFRKPTAEDFENISIDSERFTGYWKNRVIRIFLVFMLPQIGSSIGTFLVTKAVFQSIL